MPGKKKAPQKESIKKLKQKVAALERTEEKLGKKAAALLMAHKELKGSLQRQKILYEALHKSEKQSQAYLNVAGSIIIVVNSKQKLELINDKGCELLGYKEDEIIGKNWFNTCRLEPDMEKVKKHFNQLMKGKVPLVEKFENQVVTKTKEKLSISWTSHLLYDDKGKPKGTLNSGMDITERKKAEEKLQMKITELDNFVYKASHDLKGPLASIRGVLNLATKDVKDKSALQYLGLISKSTTRLNNILTELLEISTITQGTVELKLLDIEKMVKEVVESLQHASYAENVSFKLNFCKKKKIYSDRKLLASVIQNLVDNAMKYKNPDATRSFVSLKVSEYEKGVKIQVKDNGLGIPSSMRKEVFEMFFRGTDDIEGTGLGLYIVSKAIEKLGGKIELRSKKKKGTEFTVYLPN